MANNIISMTDNELVALAQTGSSDAFSRLYDTYIRKIYNFVYYKTLNKEVAEDIVSAVFLKAWRSLDTYKQDNFSAWLYSIARNTVTDYYRQKKDHKDIDDCWDLACLDDLEGRIDMGLKMEEVKKALANLKSEEREIIIMRFWLEIPFAEIANNLVKSEGAVKMSLARALKKLRVDLILLLIILAPKLIKIYESR